MLIVRFLVGVAILALVIIGALALLARSSDGPIGIVAGGPFTSGVLHPGPEPDWSFVRDLETVEFQLVDPPRSRTTWILEHRGRIFIPSGYMDSRWGRLWKQWPLEAERDGRAILRIGETLYPRHLVRIQEGPLVEPLVAELNRKYDVGATPDAVRSGALWLFELQAEAEPAASP